MQDLLRGAPQTEAEISALTAQRAELQSQLGSLARRRNQADEQRHVVDAATRRALEGEIRQIDARVQGINAQVRVLDDRIAAGIGRLAEHQALMQGPQGPQQPTIVIPPGFGAFGRPGLQPKEVAAIVGIEALGFVLVIYTVWRVGLKRMRAEVARIGAEQSRRFEQVQQALDVIGVEVERISEGQRYVAKVLGEGSAVPVGRNERLPEPAKKL
jgi:uncharacterized protein (DUF3084 family)